MYTLTIETTCDETSLALTSKTKEGLFVHSHLVLSQAQKHAEYGGVFPNVAKREHAKNLVPLLVQLIKDAKIKLQKIEIQKETISELKEVLQREPELFVHLATLLKSGFFIPLEKIVVVSGPGLDPAVWVGVNFAKSLAKITKAPIVPINHMEGHIFSTLLKGDNPYTIVKPELPSLALLISGGHTQLVLIRDFGDYKIIGETLDDAAGEAFDKVARMLDLPYPGGPEISKLAKEAREKNIKLETKFPRPILKEGYDFSFSGLKTAVKYFVDDLKKQNKLTDEKKLAIAREFEDATAEVLSEKLTRASKEFKAQSVIIGGGVSANSHIAEMIKKNIEKDIYKAPANLTGDNALMSATAEFAYPHCQIDVNELKSDPNWSIETVKPC